jgi:hypothetical protein
MNTIVALAGALEGLLKAFALLLFAVFLLLMVGPVRTAVALAAQRQRNKILSPPRTRRLIQFIRKIVGPDDEA